MKAKIMENVFICGICTMHFNTDEDLQHHMLFHDEQRRCGSCIKMSQRLRRHKRSVSGPKPHVCRNCDKHFALSEYLKIHIKTNYKCGRFFTKARNLKMRMKFCTADGMYACPTCAKCFRHFYMLKRHAQMQHDGVLHSCRLYGRTMSSTHVSSHTMKKNYSCVRCSIRHIMLQKRKKPYACQRCEKSFLMPSELEQHLATHYCSKSYSCSKCEKRFSHLSSLKRHLVLHVEGRPYVCPICGNRFSHNGYLKLHMKVHAGKKIHSCKKCGKSVLRRRMLVQHNSAHDH